MTSLMRAETLAAAEAVARCLDQSAVFGAAAARLRALDPSVVMVCARGSSGHAGTFVRYTWARHMGLVMADATPSIASVYRRRQRLAGAVCLSISQSGRSPDLIAQTELAREAGALTLAVVNDTASPLAALCDIVIDIQAGPERSVAATKTVLATLAALLGLTASWTGDPGLAAALHRLPDRLAQSAALDWSALVAVLAAVNRLFTLGRGPGFAIASEAALKLAETTGVAGLAQSSAEMAHGPRALAAADFPVLAFVQNDATRPGIEPLLADLASGGVPVLTAGTALAGCTALPTLPPDHPDADLLAQLLSFYLAAEAAAVARGRDPDRPPGLRKVTQTL